MTRRRPPSVTARASGATARSLAHAVLVDVLRDGRSLGASLRARVHSNLAPREAAFARELAFGTLRFLPRLNAWLATAMPRKPRDTGVHAVALLGVYQLMFTRVPAHAAVGATVELTRTRRHAVGGGIRERGVATPRCRTRGNRANRPLGERAPRASPMAARGVRAVLAEVVGMHRPFESGSCADDAPGQLPPDLAPVLP